MLHPSLKWAMVGMSLAALAAAGCAKGGDFIGTGGSGEGGQGAEGGGDTGTGAGSTDTGAGGDGGADTTSSSDTGSTSSTETGSTSSSSSTTSSSSSSTTTDTGCPPGQHECSGQCFGNTPQTGCLQSVSCTPCMPPANGSSICSPDGLCDFTCPAPYNKQNGACVCLNQCCSNADCAAGQTCSNGTCTGGGTCTPELCQFQCTAECLFMDKFGIGMCVGNNCNCTCI